MPEYLNLSTYQVQQLREHGECQYVRDLPGKPLTYAVGDEAGVCEAIARPLKTDSGFLYLADGRLDGRFYYRNYHMPHAACRLQVRVADVQLFPDAQQPESYCLTLKLLPDATVLSD